jgi:L-aspartate oxidase
MTDPTTAREELQHAMTHGAGVVRRATGLEEAMSVVDRIAEQIPSEPASVATCELANLATVAQGVLAAALARTESRGSHLRVEFPEQDPAWRRRLVIGSAS